MDVHIERNGERYGPYNQQDINTYLKNGTLLLTDLAWHEGLSDWVPLSQMPEVEQAVLHVDNENTKPKTVRAFTGKLLLFWIVGSIISAPLFFCYLI